MVQQPAEHRYPTKQKNLLILSVLAAVFLTISLGLFAASPQAGWETALIAVAATACVLDATHRWQRYLRFRKGDL